MRDSKGQFVKGHKVLPGSERGWFKIGSKKLPSAYKWKGGKDHPRWNGGKVTNFGGYVKVAMKDHPCADANGYVFEHRLVMEKKIGRTLLREEVVHHINGIKNDNRISNLLMFKNQREHNKIAHKLQTDEKGRFKKGGLKNGK